MKEKRGGRKYPGTQVFVPMEKAEQDRMERYIRARGLKKGAFVRLAVLRQLDTDEQAGA